MDKILKEYTTNELNEFADNYPERYNNLCAIVGEYQLGARHFILGIDLSNTKDTGCITTFFTKDNKININNVRYF